MAAKKIKIPAEKLAEARFLYEQTMAPIDDIAEVMGISRGTFFNRLRELKWQPRRFIPKRDVPRLHGPAVEAAEAAPKLVPAAAEAEPTPPSEEAVPEPLVVEYPRPPAERLALAERVQNTIERQLTAVESVLAAMGTPQPEAAEAHARTLASLARTMREMMRLHVAPPDEPADDDDVPRNIDDLRRELCRKVDALIAGRTREAACEPEQG
jgi:AcrR family transcriptional regulator